MEQVEKALRAAIVAVFGVDDVTPVIDRPDAAFGDFATNVAMQLAGRLKQNPRDLATKIAEILPEYSENVASAEVAGPGFINIRLSPEYWKQSIDAVLAGGQSYGTNKLYENQVVVAEYSDPNPFKALHAGHLYTSLVGDAIANLFTVGGAVVHRVNFGGDVGLHVAKSLWGIVQALGGENPDGLQAIAEPERPLWLSQRYIEGNQAYEEDEAAKAEIIAYNARVYRLHEVEDRDSDFAKIYWECRQWSYDYFDSFYNELGMTPFEKYYPESTTTPLGIETVKKGLEQGVFELSDGATVYKGEQDGLHTRVFLNSAGLPTYEAKDLGLALAKWRDYSFDKSFMITGNDIIEYMKVVMAALKHFNPEIAERTNHVTHGQIKLAGGVKMSSRKGNVLMAQDVLDAASEAHKQAVGSEDEAVVLGAVKYAFLKSRIGGDIIYDPAESVSLLGNSGPYLQYAHARAHSILTKAAYQPVAGLPEVIEGDEIILAKKIAAFPDVMRTAVDTLMPHHICSYLYELAQEFNRFYEHNRVVGDDRSAIRLPLVAAYATVLQNGLGVLNIPAPTHM
jgi:arginyl-tRNA synthetase